MSPLIPHLMFSLSPWTYQKSRRNTPSSEILMVNWSCQQKIFCHLCNYYVRHNPGITGDSPKGKRHPFTLLKPSLASRIICQTVGYISQTYSLLQCFESTLPLFALPHPGSLCSAARRKRSEGFFQKCILSRIILLIACFFR